MKTVLLSVLLLSSSSAFAANASFSSLANLRKSADSACIERYKELAVGLIQFGAELYVATQTSAQTRASGDTATADQIDAQIDAAVTEKSQIAGQFAIDCVKQ